MITTIPIQRYLKILLAFLPLLGFSQRSTAQELQLVKGSTQATIIIAVNANPVEQYAAQELQRTIQLMSGVTLTIAEAGQTVTGPRIVIGTPASSTEIQSKSAQMGLGGSNEEQTALLRDGNTLYLAGNSSRAALYATYTFLQERLGARWFWPGSTGEFLPKQKNICVNDLNISVAPSLKFRSVAVTNPPAGDPDTDTWMARNRMNVINIPAGADSDGAKTNLRKQKGFLTRIGSHNIVLSVDTLMAHREYGALVGGVRQVGTAAKPAHLCWSNADLQSVIANMIAKWWNDNPYNDIIHFYPADQPQFCECSVCADMGDVSTRWQKFSSLVIAKVNATHPEKKYWTYAYQGYRPAPQVTPAPFEYIGYTLYNGNYRGLLSGTDAVNAVPKGEMAGWLAKGAQLGIRGYEYIIFKDPMTVPLVSWEIDQLNWAHNNNLIGSMSETPAYGYPKGTAPENTTWTVNRMTLYAAAQAMWNSSVSPQKLVTDWCTKIYGPAGGDMSAYYWYLEGAWRNAPGSVTYFLNAPASEVDNVFSPAKFQQLFTHLADARTAVPAIVDATKRSRAELSIATEMNMLLNWQKNYYYKTGNAGNYKTNVIKTTTVNETLWQNTPKLLPFRELTGQAAAEQTDVKIAWTATSLAFKIVCNDNAIGSLKSKYLSRDENVMADDCIELFIQPNPANAAYYHLAVNAKNVRYDAASTGGSNEDKSWNPEYTTATSLQANSWTLNFEIPFSSLGITAQDAAQFKLGIRRGRAGRAPNSGWPEASSNPGSFGTATLYNVTPPTKRIIFYDAGGDSGDMSVTFQEGGWDAARVDTLEADLTTQLDNQHTDVLLIRYTTAKFKLSTAYMSGKINDFMQNGGVVILTANGDIPVNTWFTGTPKVDWSGSAFDPIRKSIYVREGTWLDSTNNINTVIKAGVTPASGYMPADTTPGVGWQIMASMKMQDATAKPYLLIQKKGQGMLVLSSSAMGYSGGYEMFGNRNTLNIVKLAENLLWRNKHPN
ncbi:DUF4838 domain-containing protein [Chitinophaga qingshengii]|uniref:DUF4838 domain-containing protein n=1 Tax=Chitinophaga qingshengii TaxID=1569794 RepID=A0ABR7TID2_9BACT|nr:DUF4838 domain-containing protein [Chitinophaga qingshengii]MBC9929395.1 DUF4838 domain-containing protein [Chitinophaga qingshengii]